MRNEKEIRDRLMVLRQLYQQSNDSTDLFSVEAQQRLHAGINTLQWVLGEVA